jgi:hypothetical protein
VAVLDAIIEGTGLANVEVWLVAVAVTRGTAVEVSSSEVADVPVAGGAELSGGMFCSLSGAQAPSKVRQLRRTSKGTLAVLRNSLGSKWSPHVYCDAASGTKNLANFERITCAFPV